MQEREAAIGKTMASCRGYNREEVEYLLADWAGVKGLNFSDHVPDQEIDEIVEILREEKDFHLSRRPGTSFLDKSCGPLEHHICWANGAQYRQQQQPHVDSFTCENKKAGRMSGPSPKPQPPGEGRPAQGLVSDNPFINGNYGGPVLK
jgi:hypothetical protein